MRSFGLIALISLGAATAAHAQATGSPQEGLRIARAQCAECHRVVGERGGSPNLAAPSFEQIATTRGMSSRALTAALRTSHRTMPNLIIPDAEVRDIVAYIMSLKSKE